jgi:hypothetical protein
MEPCWSRPAPVDQCEARILHTELGIDGTTTRVLVEKRGAIDVSILGDITGHLISEER